MDAALRAFVRERAGDRFAYCRLHEDDADFLSFRVTVQVLKINKQSRVMLRENLLFKAASHPTSSGHGPQTPAFQVMKSGCLKSVPVL